MILILLIDHFDSFTYNLKQLLQEIGEDVAVYRPDDISLEEILEMKPSAIMLSSGSKNLLNTDISHQLIGTFKNNVPILGIGLGHLMIAEHFGANITPVQTIKHGKTGLITHTRTGPFSYLEQPLEVMRYHSFVVDRESLPSSLEVIATALDDDEIMSLKHRDYPVYGFQFQPDSIGTTTGRKLIENFLRETEKGE